jgi:NosR/NirI family transcriptional regulator, nitrous oxide reductase regulator
MTPQIKKNTWALFWFFLSLGLLLAGAAYFEWGHPFLRFLWSRPFLTLLKFLLIAAFVLAALKWLTHKYLPQRWLKWVYGILFLPVLLLPVFRCYFKVPYIFCRACPHKCPWGILRTLAFPAFLLLNLSNKFWCAALCPFGSFQECQTQVSFKRFKLPSWGELFAYLVLLLVTGMYFLTLFGSSGVQFFEMGRYAWVEVSVGVAIVILLAAFFIPKFWCRYFCPVGTIDEMIASFRRSSPPRKESV